MRKTLVAVSLVCLLTVPTFGFDVVKLTMCSGQPANFKAATTLFGPLMARIGIPIPAKPMSINLGLGAMFRIQMNQNSVLSLNPLIAMTVSDTSQGPTPYVPLISSDNVLSLCLGKTTGPEFETKFAADYCLTAAPGDPKIVPSGYLFGLQRLNG
ncbi:MAG: hypothetical protein PHV78_00395 [Patescibacteria group bacterium]|nr:hypothetical protein [Patescibacteria group bacterium]MDD5121368.1 hypothetical protein [Patescibacteria group bacterium]MDD5221774.1 hypothetical protein [Patescibacteria group bacterium]MDD5395713.1 hypothetical protein [Patescibacteria group bacterium]